MKRIYVAGPYSGNTIQTLRNIRVGIRVCTEILLAGDAPFCPWLDHQYLLALRNNETLTVDTMRRYSLAWLAVSDEMLVLPGWERSVGTKAEIVQAHVIGIPVRYYSSQPTVDTQ